MLSGSALQVSVVGWWYNKPLHQLVTLNSSQVEIGCYNQRYINPYYYILVNGTAEIDQNMYFAPFAHFPYGYMAILPKYGHNAIIHYGYMAWDMANMGVYQESNANVAIWSRRFIDQPFQ